MAYQPLCLYADRAASAARPATAAAVAAGAAGAAGAGAAAGAAAVAGVPGAAGAAVAGAAAAAAAAAGSTNGGGPSSADSLIGWNAAFGLLLRRLLLRWPKDLRRDVIIRSSSLHDRSMERYTITKNGTG